jgi:hypothetical protein
MELWYISILVTFYEKVNYFRMNRHEPVPADRSHCNRYDYGSPNLEYLKGCVTRGRYLYGVRARRGSLR